MRKLRGIVVNDSMSLNNKARGVVQFFLALMFMCVSTLSISSTHNMQLTIEGSSQLAVEVETMELSSEKSLKIISKLKQLKRGEPLPELVASGEKPLVKFEQVRSLKVIGIVGVGNYYFADVLYTSIKNQQYKLRESFQCMENNCTYVPDFHDGFIDSVYMIYSDQRAAGTPSIEISAADWNKYDLKTIGGQIPVYLREKSIDDVSADSFESVFNRFYSKLEKTYSAASPEEYSDLLLEHLGYRRGAQSDYYLRVVWSEGEPESKVSDTLLFRGEIKRIGVSPSIIDSYSFRNSKIFVVRNSSSDEFFLITTDNQVSKILNGVGNLNVEIFHTKEILALLASVYAKVSIP